MTHPTSDELVLLTYGELSESAARDVESHVAVCSGCREQLAQLDRSRAALDVAIPPRPTRAVAWAGFGLAAAAVLAIVLSTKPDSRTEQAWRPTTTWSATAGYVAGGKAVVDIDAQLTRLEQEKYYGLPD